MQTYACPARTALRVHTYPIGAQDQGPLTPGSAPRVMKGARMVSTCTVDAGGVLSMQTAMTAGRPTPCHAYRS